MPRSIKTEQGELRDEIRQPLFDAIDILSGTSPINTYRFFSAVQGKPASQTNLRQNNLLENQVSFRILGLSLDAVNVYEANSRALGLIMEHSAIKLRIGEKDYWNGPATYVTGRVWQDAALLAGSTVAAVAQSYGQPAVAGVVLAGKHVVDVPPLQSFAVDVVCEGMSAAEITASTPAANTKIRLIFGLKGIQRRPVQ
jgi:hypothetical protein